MNLFKLISARAAFARNLGGAVISQGLLSVINLSIGLILIRRVSHAQYGYYVLIAATAPLLVQFQNSLIAPLLTSRVTTASDDERKDYVGGLMREQRRLLAIVTTVGLLGCLLIWLGGRVPTETLIVLLAGVVASIGALFRDFMRIILITYRRPYDVLRTDVVYALVFVGGVWVSTLSGVPAALSALAMASGAIASGLLLARVLRRMDPWHTPGMRGAFSQSVVLGLWSATGAVIHWVFQQGYTYIVALQLDVTAVAAIAATRLLLSPLGVFSLGINSLMFSTSTLWLKHHGPRGLMRRVLVFALGMACMGLVYVAVMWWMRDWIFLHILKRDYPQRDLLLGIWSMVFICTVIRDQVIYLQMARGHFKRLAGLTALCAVLGLSVTLLSIRHYGAAGGLLGLFAGELLHVIGVLVLAIRDLRETSMKSNDLPALS